MLLAESLEFLDSGRGGLFVDCTLGLGGHSQRLLESADDVEVIGIDRDPQALSLATEHLAGFKDRFRSVEGEFGDLEELLDSIGVGKVRGIFADLGVSSMQLDRAERGFSFQRDGPLDMRMGDSGLSAQDIVNSYSEAKLQQIFKDYGEERQARRIARAIGRERELAPIETTAQLRRIVGRSKGGHREKIDPATRVFQALRIEVNQELKQLEKLLEQGVRRLEPEGRIVIISYHSLEDRIVKNVFRTAARGEVDPITGRSLSESQALELMTRKPIRPGASEVAVNPRSRSARLRAARRI